jgi:flagellar hook-associated protein 3 FlgL
MAGSFRVTEQSTTARVLSGLQHNQSRLERLREQVSTGKQVARPSDSPTGVVASMRLRADTAETSRHQRSAADGLARLGTAEAALTSAGTLLNRARELVLQGRSSPAVNSPAAREGIATEITTLRDSMIALANTTYLGRPVFGGTTGSERAFASDGGYLGDDGEVLRRVADGVQVRVDVPSSAFGTGPNQLFDVMASIAGALRTDPAALGTALDRLDSAASGLNTTLTQVGARYGQLTEASEAAVSRSIQLSAQLSDVEDVDLVRAVVDLETRSAGYQAALAASARVVQPSLLDFLR